MPLHYYKNGDPGASRTIGSTRMPLHYYKNGDPGASRTRGSTRMPLHYYKNGDPGASRTHNLLLRTELLYPLSYGATLSI